MNKKVRDFLADRMRKCRAAGIAHGRIALDPELGLEKTLDHNLELLQRLCEQSVAEQAHSACSV